MKSAGVESDIDEGEPLPELYVPEVPSSVLGAFFTQRDTLVLLMSGYDAGYSYEYSIPEPEKPARNLRSEPIADCEGKEIRSFLF